MARFLLPLLLLVVLAGAPLSVSAQSTCDLNNPSSCPAGSKCKSVNDASPKCVPDTCTPACTSGQTCFLGTCIATPTGDGANTAPTPNGDGPNTAPTPGRGDTGLTNPLKNIDSLPQLLETVLKAIVQIGTIILTLALVYVGFLFVVAQGNQEKISNAKSALLWTIIGGLILLGASAIGAVIGATVNTL